MKLWIVLVLLRYGLAEDFPSLITANASIAVVLDRQFLGEGFQTMLDELKDYIKELARVELKHGGINVHYFSWTAISLKKGYLAIFSIASCEDTWSLFSRTEEEQLLLFALTEVDCPRLPKDSAITVTFADPGQELPQLLLDLRIQKAINWKSTIILHDDTLGRDMITRVVESLTSQIDDKDVPSISVTVFKMKHEVNEYLRRKEVHRVLSRLPVKYIGENFIAVVTIDVMGTIAETARELLMSHTQAQWLYVVSDTNQNDNFTNLINYLYEGENIAYIYNNTNSDERCKNSLRCYAKEMLNAFISALDSAVQEEFDVAVQVSDEEWEAIRPTKEQRRDTLLRHMQQYITAKSKCGNCSSWQLMAADTWGTTYREKTFENRNNMTSIVIEDVELLHVGVWRPIDGIRFDDVLFPHVAHGFRGKELPIITYHNPPWTILQLNASGSIISYSGLLFDIVDQLAKNKNFTTIYCRLLVRGCSTGYLTIASRYVSKLCRMRIAGGKLMPGNADKLQNLWAPLLIRILLPGNTKQNNTNETAMDMTHSISSMLTLSAVANGHAALAAASFSVLRDHSPGINYTVPVSTQTYSFMIARPRELSRALLFLLPFTTDTWLCLGFAVILMGPTLYIVHRASPFYNAAETTREGGLSTIHNCLWYIYGALLQQGGMYLPRADSGRLVVGTWWIVVLVVVTTYSGNLVAFLTFPKLEMPITTLSELLESKTYTWSITKGSFLEMQLKDSDEPKYIALLKGAEMTEGINVVEGSLVSGPELLHRVRNQRHALIDWKLRLSYLMRADTVDTDTCDFALSTEEFMDEQVAMIVPAGSPYLPVINKEITRMHKAGLIAKWLSAYLPKRDRCWKTSTVEKVNNHTVNLSDMQGSFFVLFLGVFSALTVLFLEWIYNRRKQRVEQIVIKPYIE